MANKFDLIWFDLIKRQQKIVNVQYSTCFQPHLNSQIE